MELNIVTSETLSQALSTIEKAQSLQELEEIRVAFLGKKGIISLALKELGTLSADERKERGPQVHKAREAVQTALSSQQKILEEQALEERLAREWLDLSLPPIKKEEGKVHPITQVLDEILAFFVPLGFTLREGPEIESDEYNFTALNIPAHHPARQMHDTFYIDSHHVLRTHTSPVQARVLRSEKPPYRFLSMGRVYRSDADATHSPMFHQVEGFAVQEGITWGHMTQTLRDFLRVFFEIKDLKVRLRPSFFPFTSPSAEVDIGYEKTETGLKLGGDSHWMEILGCGMVHPNVFTLNGHKEYIPGFAFGMGVERLAMLKYGLSDLRPFYEGDLRWLRHHGFSGLSSPSLFSAVAQ